MMNDIKNKICYIVTFIILIATIYCLGIDSNIRLIKYILVIFIDLILIYNELFNIKEKNKKLLILDSIVIIIAFYMWAISYKYIYLVYITISLLQIIRSLGQAIYYIVLAINFIIINFITYLTISDDTLKWKLIIQSNSILILTNIFIYLLAFILKQSGELEKSKRKLLNENIKAESMYYQLKRAYDELENYTVLKERDRIAREMHDSIGHNLTMTLVQLESYGMDKVKDEDKEEFSRIVGSVRNALYNIRTTVHKVKECVDRWSEVDKFISNIKEKEVIKVNYSRDEFNNINVEIIKCVYNIIREAITNGINHGKADAFIIAIRSINNKIILRVINNGKSAIAYKKGFGLSSMEQRVKSLDGKLEIESGIGEGFTITVEFNKELDL